MHEQINQSFRGTPIQISGTLSLCIFLYPENSSCFGFPELCSMFLQPSKNVSLCLNFHSVAWKLPPGSELGKLEGLSSFFFLVSFFSCITIFHCLCSMSESSFFMYFVLISIVYGKRTITVAITTLGWRGKIYIVF